jgi:hypothetical protein
VIYLDSSVVLARLFAEDRQPDDDFWAADLTSSRLLEYEVWTRARAQGLSSEDEASVVHILRGVEFVELSRLALARAVEPFPSPLRTLDALHLSTAHFLRQQGKQVELASYDTRLLAAAHTLGIPLREL